MNDEEFATILAASRRIGDERRKQQYLIKLEVNVKFAKKLGATKNEILTAVCYGLGLVEDES